MTSLKQIKIKYKPLIIKTILRFKRYKISDAIIIFSEARGGSTWLMELLKNIPGVIINWEPLSVTQGVIPTAYNLGWRPYLPVDNREPKYKKLFSEIFSFKTFNTWTTSQVFYKDLKGSKHVLTKFVRANQCLLWVVHTFPSLKHRPILLLRHPITTCVSRLIAFERIPKTSINSIRHNGDFNVPNCINNERFIKHKDYINGLTTKLEVEIAIWCINNTNIIEHGDKHKWLTVYYEDLVLEPKETLRNILNGIGLDFHENMLNSINYRKPSTSNYRCNLHASPRLQLESFIQQFSKEEMQRFQGIFDYFGLKVYTAFDPYPTKT